MINSPQQTDMVSHPKHYDKGDKTYEPYKVIQAWKCSFNIGNAIKYLSRYQSKWNPIEDLEKAKKYIDFEIEYLREKANTNLPDEARRPICIGTPDEKKVPEGNEDGGNAANKDLRTLIDSICRGDRKPRKWDPELKLNNIPINDVLNRAGEIFGDILKSVSSGEMTEEEALKKYLGMTDEEIKMLYKGNYAPKISEVERKFGEDIKKGMHTHWPAIKNSHRSESRPYFTKQPL